MTDTTTATVDVTHTALIRLIRGAFNGTNEWADVGHKLGQLFQADVVDPAEVFVEQFATDFGKAAMTEVAKVVPQLLQEVIEAPENIGAIIADEVPNILKDLENLGIQVAETDAIQSAQTIVGNALRVQLTAAQMVAATTPIQEPVPNAASSPTLAVPSAAVDPVASPSSGDGTELPSNVASHTITEHD